MRPDSNHDRAKRLSPSRARTLLKAHFGWLQGFPIRQSDGAVDWRSCDARHGYSGTTIQIDRETIRQAEYALNKLEHQYASVIRQIVPEPERWPARVRQILKRLKAAVHDGTSFPSYLPEFSDALSATVRQVGSTISKKHPELRSIVDALSWVLHTDPDSASSAIKWMEAHGHELAGLLASRHGILTEETAAEVITLWRLAHHHGEGRTANLTHYLGDKEWYRISFDRQEYQTYLKAWSQHLNSFQAKWPADPVPTLSARTLGQEFRKFAQWLTVQLPNVQALALDFFNLVADDTLVESCREYAKKVDDELSAARRMMRIQAGAHFDRVGFAVHAARLQSLADESLEIGIGNLIETLAILLRPRSRLLREELLEILPLLPSLHGGNRVREFFLLEAAAQLGYGAGSQAASAVRQFRRYLAGPDPDRHLAPFLDQPSKEFGSVLACSPRELRDRPRFYSALRLLIASGITIVRHELVTLRSLASLLLDEGDVVDRFRSLQSAGVGTSVYPDVLRSAEHLRRGGTDFGQMALRLAQLDYEILGNLTLVVERLAGEGREDIAACLARHGEFGFMAKLGRRSEFARAFGDRRTANVTSTTVSEVSDWAHQYPADLHEALRWLAMLSNRAEAIASRVLAKEFSPRQAIEREATSIENLLESRPDDAWLTRRLANLRSRLASPPTVSIVRLAHLRTHLELAACRSWTDDWVQRVETESRRLVQDLLGMESLPDWVWQPSHLKLLTSLARLQGQFRTHGIEIFRRRCGPPPWDFRDALANRHFLELLHARGVDSSPWLDPPSDVVVEATGGERYRVGFELDPVEVLRMGEPFGTCLAPGDVNFFSAVANAVDINKRLIYARDRRGVIVGRCLLALTESGHILTFRVYQNAQGFDFQAVIREMVNGLATRMGTHVVRRGRVPTLVATNWYDDGPHDLCGRFGCLADESPFRNSLLSIPLPELMDAVRLAFEPFAVDELTLPLLLELDEFQKRPELILPLLPLLDGDAHLLEQTCWQAAALAHRAGRSDFALQLLNRRAYPRLIRAVRNHGVCPCCSEPVLRTLAEADPSIALRILRATRSKRVRSDEEEFDGRRRALLITAHERLGRAELASRLKKVDTS